MIHEYLFEYKDSLEIEQDLEEGYIETLTDYLDESITYTSEQVNKRIKEEIAAKYEDPEIRKQKEAELTPVLRQLMFFDKNGQRPSLNGLQMFSEYVHGDLVDRRIDLENQLKALSGIYSG